MNLQSNQFNISNYQQSKRKWQHIRYHVASDKTISYTKPCLLEFNLYPQKARFRKSYIIYIYSKSSEL